MPFVFIVIASIIFAGSWAAEDEIATVSAGHPTDKAIRQEAYFTSVVLPFIEKAYPVQASADGRLLLGFSKSGWGAWSLLLRHPDVFGRAAAWDAPMMMDRLGQYGTSAIFGDQDMRPMQPDTFSIRFTSRLWSGPVHPVARVLHDGDEVAGFRVVHAPGHTPGHIILFRDEDRVAIVGDVLNGMNLVTTWPGLHEPPSFFCTDLIENRRSIRRLAGLEPRLLCFGHGPPLSAMKKFDRFLNRLDARHRTEEDDGRYNVTRK